MKYELVAAYGKATALGFSWQNIDINELGALPMHQIYRLYQKVYLTLSSPALSENIHIDLDILKTKYINSQELLSDVLANQPNTPLPSLSELPIVERKTVRYEDGFKAGYKISLVSADRAPDAVTDRSQLTEVAINRPMTDMSRFHEYALVTINGFLHRTDTNGFTVFVNNGGVSLHKSKLNNIGILSFEDIGKVKQYPITPEMLFKLDDRSDMSKKVYFNLKDIDTENKTVMLSIGGYLYLPDPAFVRQWSDDVYMVDFTQVDLKQRWFESAKYLDLSAVGLDKYPFDTTQISISQLLNDHNFIKYLTLPQSFIIVVDTPKLYWQRHYLRHNEYPGMFIAHKEPKFPLFAANNRMCEYWKIEEDGHWSVNVHDSYWENKHFMSLPHKDVISATNANLPYRTFYNSKGYLLEIGVDLPVEIPVITDPNPPIDPITDEDYIIRVIGVEITLYSTISLISHYTTLTPAIIFTGFDAHLDQQSTIKLVGFDTVLPCTLRIVKVDKNLMSTITYDGFELDLKSVISLDSFDPDLYCTIRHLGTSIDLKSVISCDNYDVDLKSTISNTGTDIDLKSTISNTGNDINLYSVITYLGYDADTYCTIRLVNSAAFFN